MVLRFYPNTSWSYKGPNGGGAPWNYIQSESIWGRQPFIWRDGLMRRGGGAEVIFPHQAIALYREPEGGTDRHRSSRGSHFLGGELREEVWCGSIAELAFSTITFGTALYSSLALRNGVTRLREMCCDYLSFRFQPAPYTHRRLWRSSTCCQRPTRRSEGCKT
jgi:hypothetical protein